MTDDQAETRKKERSPSFPFISLKKAVERARAVHDRYRRESVRVIIVGSAWGLGPKSSGLQQTVAALKQYGLMEDSGSREDRRVVLTQLALRILIDTRPGQREDGLREAALKPRLFAELAPWARSRPAEEHCMSELKLDRGFTDDAARTFLRVFFETMEFAGIGDEADEDIPAELEDEAPEERSEYASPATTALLRTPVSAAALAAVRAFDSGPVPPSAGPLSERIRVELTPGALRVAALVRTPAEADTLIQFIQANKALLTDVSDLV